MMNAIPELMKQIKLTELMQGDKQVILKHDDKLYKLSITRRGKLILTAAY
jgi:hemin uptake protein HemP